jgi:hypothetical protein
VLEIEVTLIHLQHTDVLNLGVATEIVFLDAGVHTITVTLTTRNVNGVTVNNARLRWRVLTVDLHAVPVLRLSLDSVERRLDFLSRHSPIILLEKISESVLECLAAPGGLRDSDGGTNAQTAQEIPACFVEIAAISGAVVITHWSACSS